MRQGTRRSASGGGPWCKAERSETGSLTAFTAIFMVALLGVGGLVVDGGRFLAQRQAAIAEADQAARAGASALDTASLREGSVTVDPVAGVDAAEASMIAAGHPGTASVNGSVVSVTVSAYRVPTALLGIMGITHFTVSATAQATAVHGVAAADS